MKTQQRILNKLLWKKSNLWQIAGALAGVYIGLTLLLCSMQFYLDIKQLLGGGKDESSQLVQVNKRVNILNTLGVKPAFTELELEALSTLPFIQKVGSFEANQFKAGAYSEMLGFYTELFFEAVPDDFLDVDEPSFRWSEGQRELPVIMSKEYLALYNFGFAPSRGLPQISASTITRFSLDVSISGNGIQQTFQGKVVGFSDRINSILVPTAFMKWANQKFANGSQPPSKLIVKVDNPMSQEFQSYLKDNGYEVSAGKLIGGQFGVLFKLAMSVMAGFGAVILLLSVLVFSLNFQILVARAFQEISLMMQLGYKAGTISKVLDKKFTSLFLAVVVLVILSILGIRYLMVQYVQKQGFELNVNLHPWVWVAGILLSASMLVYHFLITRKNIGKVP